MLEIIDLQSYFLFKGMSLLGATSIFHQPWSCSTSNTLHNLDVSPNQTQLIQFICSLVKTPRPKMVTTLNVTWTNSKTKSSNELSGPISHRYTSEICASCTRISTLNSLSFMNTGTNREQHCISKAILFMYVGHVPKILPTPGLAASTDEKLKINGLEIITALQHSLGDYFKGMIT